MIMTVRSEEKSVLDEGSIPSASSNIRPFNYECNLFFTDREWSRIVGWGNPSMGATGFDRTTSTRTDNP